MLLCACLLLSQAATARTIVVGSSGVVTSATSTGFISTDEPDGSVRIWRLGPKSHQFELFEAFFPDAERPPTDGYSFIASVSPDGKHVLLQTTAHKILVYSLRPAKLVRSLPVIVSGLPVWSPDGRRFAVQDGDRALIAGVESGRVWKAGLQNPFVFSRDGRYLAGKTPKGAALVDLKSEKLVQTFEEDLETTMPFDVSPDGKWLATGGEDPNWRGPQLAEGEVATESSSIHQGTIKIWRISDGKRVRLLPGPTNGYATDVFFRDSRRLVAPSMGVTYDALTGRVVERFKELYAADIFGKPNVPMDRGRPLEERWGALPAHPGVGRTLAFSKDGRLAISTVGDGNFNMLADELSVWRLSDLTKLKTLHAPTGGMAMGFWPDGSLIAAGEEKLTRFDRNLSVKSLPPPPQEILRILPDARHALLWRHSEEGVVDYDLFKGFAIDTFRLPAMDAILQPGSVNSVAMERLPKSRYALVLRDREQRPLWQIEGGGFSENVAFSTEGKWLAAIRYEDGKQRLILIDVGSGKVQASEDLSTHPSQLLFSPDGKRLAASTAEGLEIRDGGSLRLLATKRMSVRRSETALAFSPDGSRLAVARTGLDVQLLDANTLETEATLIPFDDGNWISWDRMGLVRGTPGGRAKLRTVTDRGLLPVRRAE